MGISGRETRCVTHCVSGRNPEESMGIGQGNASTCASPANSAAVIHRVSSALM